jgi:hypothetical protein
MTKFKKKIEGLAIEKPDPKYVRFEIKNFFVKIRPYPG